MCFYDDKMFIDGVKYRKALDLYDSNKVCIHLDEYEKGKCFHENMKNILINLYGDCGATETAKDIFNEIEIEKRDILQLSMY